MRTEPDDAGLGKGRMAHGLARRIEGASHIAEDYTRVIAGNIGVLIDTSDVTLLVQKASLEEAPRRAVV